MPDSTLSPERYALAVITDDADLFRDIRKLLAPQFRTTLASSEADIKSVLELPDLNAILLDLDCIGNGPTDGLEVLAELRKLRDDVVLFAFSRSNNRTLPLKAAQAGADEFFLYPLIFGELHIVLSRVIEKRALELEGRRLLQQVEDKAAFYGIIGGSSAMQKVYQAVEAVASTGASVVLRGESGVGKELVAKAIVQCGNRAGHPFVCLNCSALPETLMESELFGYEKGAFTGADSAKPGMVEMAHNGTLFLDEITTLHPSLQSKLLRVLQEHSVQRLGGRATRKIDFRLITATNDDLEDIVRKGQFREDLYFRINVVPIFIPPLHERDGDIPLLVDHFLRVYSAAAKKPLKAHPAGSPGNPRRVQLGPEMSGNWRTLFNAWSLWSQARSVTPEHLPQLLLHHSATGQEAILIPEGGVDFDSEMEKIEIAYLNAALRRTSGKKSAAAALLRIDSQRMKYLCRKHRIE